MGYILLLRLMYSADFMPPIVAVIEVRILDSISPISSLLLLHLASPFRVSLSALNIQRNRRHPINPDWMIRE